MSETFDPYDEWLHIPPGEQPPTYYRLLSLPELESDPRAIETAAQQTLSDVLPHESGPHGESARRLFSEIVRARACLLDADQKSAYDDRLRAESRREAERSQVAAPVASPPPESPQVESAPQTPKRPPPRMKSVAVGGAAITSAAALASAQPHAQPVATPVGASATPSAAVGPSVRTYSRRRIDSTSLTLVVLAALGVMMCFMIALAIGLSGDDPNSSGGGDTASAKKTKGVVKPRKPSKTKTTPGKTRPSQATAAAADEDSTDSDDTDTVVQIDDEGEVIVGDDADAAIARAVGVDPNGTDTIVRAGESVTIRRTDDGETVVTRVVEGETIERIPGVTDPIAPGGVTRVSPVQPGATDAIDDPGRTEIPSDDPTTVETPSNAEAPTSDPATASDPENESPTNVAGDDEPAAPSIFDASVAALAVPSQSDAERSSGTDPVPLGPLPVGDGDSVDMTLIGGEELLGRYGKIALVRDGTRSWVAAISADDDAPAPVAEFKITDGELTFRWLDGAAATPAGKLRNGLLEVSAGGRTKQFPLRAPRAASPVTVDAKNGGALVKYELGDLPETSALRLEILDFDGLAHSVEPDQVIAAQHNTNIRLTDQPLSYRVTFNRDDDDITVIARPHALRGKDNWKLITSKAGTAEYDRMMAQRGQLQAHIDRIAKIRDTVSGGQRKTMDQQAVDMQLRIDAIDARLPLFQESKIDFRIFANVGDRQVELLTTRDSAAVEDDAVEDDAAIDEADR